MIAILTTFIIIFNYFVVFYYGLVNAVYSLLLFIALFVIIRHIKRVKYSAIKDLQRSPEVPPVTVIIPAFNERSVVLRTVRSVLALNYPYFDIIVVNDGSDDTTLKQLMETYRLKRIDLVYRSFLKTKPVKAFYYNKEIPNLLVIDKERGGKADALNCGINACRNPYFCSIDADTIIESDALLRLMSAVMESTKPVIACGGVVRVMNGVTLKDVTIEKISLPSKSLPLFQVVEYLRSFLFGRVGLDCLNATLILSGAFSLFSKEAVLEVGGYALENVSEDMELIVKLHKHYITSGKPYAIRFITDPICWTEVPETLRMLARQRRRWHLGLIQTVFQNKSLFFNPKYGKLGIFVMPYYVFVEMLSPLVEVTGYLVLTGAYFLGLINYKMFVLFLIFAVLYGIFLSVAGIFLEEMTYRRYPGWRHLFTLMLFGVIENFGYRQMNSFWRVQAFYKYFIGKHHWEVVRKQKPARKVQEHGL